MTVISVSIAEKKNTVIQECIYKKHKLKNSNRLVNKGGYSMLIDALERLRRADNLLNDSRRFTDTEPYYLNRIRDISSDLELLIEEIETHV